MGIFSFLKKQFIDVIDWTESGSGVLAVQYPMQDREIQNGAQLTVRDTQMALFVDEGKIADVLGPGRHTLTTQTLPLLTNLKHWDKAFASPFKSDVFFFSTREQIDQKWGTSNAIVIRDKDFGQLRVRAHGIFSYRIKDPKKFFTKLSGTTPEYAVRECEGQLRGMILTSLASFFGSSQVSFLDMAANQTQFSDTLKEALTPSLADYGLKLETFFVQSVTLPEELQAYLDKATNMRMVGDLRTYAQFQTADSIKAAAENSGGVAGAGAGMGAGLAIGQAMAQSLGQGNAGTASAPANAEDALTTISKLHDMLTKGIITQAEFDAKKNELMKKIM